MSVPSIILPPTPEDRKKEKAAAETLRRAAVLEMINRFSGLLDGLEMEHRIKALCSRLINMNGRIVIRPMFTCPEIGRLISDALLGPGREYEVKT